jgi:uncharacterized RDD family membrane protein YckC
MGNFETAEVRLATPAHRIGAGAVDVGLYIVTLGIGWIIWNIVTMTKGQSPGKSLLKVRVINKANGQPARWGHMFIRQALIPFSLSVFYAVPYYLWLFKGFTTDMNPLGIVALVLCIVLNCAVGVTDFVWLFGKSRRRLLDYWAGTVVVNEA